MWTPALGRFWRKKLKKQFDLDGINENAEEKAARAKGWGRHLHLQIVLKENVADIFMGQIKGDLKKDSYNPFKHKDKWIK